MGNPTHRNHASNAYMLHALGITHVVSVGECALVPPMCPMPRPGSNGVVEPGTQVNFSSDSNGNGSSNSSFVYGSGPNGQGSLWIEEREGRIKVLDIKGVSDDGIDSLRPQFAPICDWIEKARQENGKVCVFFDTILQPIIPWRSALVWAKLTHCHRFRIVQTCSLPRGRQS